MNGHISFYEVIAVFCFFSALDIFYIHWLWLSHKVHFIFSAFPLKTFGSKEGVLNFAVICIDSQENLLNI